jgi:hypothetical protein
MCQTFQKDQSFGTKVIAQKPVCLQTDDTKPTDVDTIDGWQLFTWPLGSSELKYGIIFFALYIDFMSDWTWHVPKLWKH